MDFVDKIKQYLEDNGHIYVCVFLFAVTTTIVCAFLFTGITAQSEPNDSAQEKSIPNKADTTYIILQSQIDEVRVATYSVSKDSIWVAPTSNKVTIRDNRK